MTRHHKRVTRPSKGSDKRFVFGLVNVKHTHKVDVGFTRSFEQKHTKLSDEVIVSIRTAQEGGGHTKTTKMLSGKAEHLLSPMPKENIPPSTYHVDFITPLPSANKKYQHIFRVIDVFTKFAWFYPVKSTSSQDEIEKLKLQQNVFGNLSRIVSDRGAVFTSKGFGDYCSEQGIEHIKITTGIARGNGQVELIHGVMIPVLAKLSIEDQTKWYKYLAYVQRIINSTTSRSTKYTPFELMIGV